MEQLIYENGYQEYKEELHAELEKTSEGFVRIGYLLKVARDTDILVGSGYSDYKEFAKSEFGLDKSMVSRFININDRFSEGGNSDRLLEQYKGFGYAKLAMMLTLPEVITEELTPDYTKSEIAQIKEQIDEEKAKTEIEHMAENMDALMNPPVENIVIQTIRAIGEAYPLLYIDIWNGIAPTKDLMAPLDQTLYTVRVPGTGKVILIAEDKEATLTIIRTEEKLHLTNEEIAYAWSIATAVDANTAKEAWEKTYGKEFPAEEEKEEVAPVQPNPQRVNIPKTETPKKEKTKKEQKSAPKKAEEPKTHFTEYSSEESDVEDEENETSEEAETPINTASAEENAINTQCAEVSDATVRGWKAGLTSDIHALERLARENNFRAVRTKLEGMMNIVNRIIEKEEKK